MAITLNGTTGIASVDASVSAPSVRGTDGNTGISYGADSIKFSTGGVERMAISNSGVTGVSGGKILQVVQCAKNDTESQASGQSGSTFDGTLYDIAGTDQAGSGSVFCVKITPSATSSKILFTSTLNVGGASVLLYQMFRDSTAINIGATVSGKQPASVAYKAGSGGNGSGFYGPVNMVSTYLDSPSSTSELTYKVKWGCSHSGQSIYLNRAQDDSNVYRFRPASSLVVMEVSA